MNVLLDVIVVDVDGLFPAPEALAACFANHLLIEKTKVLSRPFIDALLGSPFCAPFFLPS